MAPQLRQCIIIETLLKINLNTTMKQLIELLTNLKKNNEVGITSESIRHVKTQKTI